MKKIIIGVITVILFTNLGFAENRKTFTKGLLRGLIVPGGAYAYAGDKNTAFRYSTWEYCLAGIGTGMILISKKFETNDPEQPKSSSGETLDQSIESSGWIMVLIASVLHLAGAYHGATQVNAIKDLDVSVTKNGYNLKLTKRF